MAYNPGVTDRSGEILAQGLNSTIAQYGQDMDLMRENERKRRTAAGQVQGLLAANPQLAQKADPALIQKLSVGKANLNDTLQLLGTLSTVKKQEEDELMNQVRRQQMQAVAVQMKGYEQEHAMRARSMQQEEELNTRFDQAINQSKTKGVLPPDLQAKVAELAQSPAAQLRGMGVRLTPQIMADLAKAQMNAKPPFNPELRDLGNGVSAMMTSPNSAVPISRGQPAGVPGSNGVESIDIPGVGTIVVDKVTRQPVATNKIMRAPNNNTAGRIDPMLVGTITQQIQKLEAEKLDHQQNTTKDDNNYGFLNLNSRGKRLQEIEAQLAGLRATLNAGGKALPSGTAAPTASMPQAAPAARDYRAADVQAELRRRGLTQ